MFYLVCHSLQERTALIKRLKEIDIVAVFHYLCTVANSTKISMMAVHYSNVTVLSAAWYDSLMYYDMNEKCGAYL